MIASPQHLSVHPAARPIERLIVKPLFGPRGGMDVTGVVATAIAEHLSAVLGGNEVLNRLEAERLLHQALADLRGGRL